jgi:hypothetical protein
MSSSSSARVLQLSPKAGVLSSQLLGGIPKTESYYQVPRFHTRKHPLQVRSGLSSILSRGRLAMSEVLAE